MGISRRDSRISFLMARGSLPNELLHEPELAALKNERISSTCLGFYRLITLFVLVLPTHLAFSQQAEIPFAPNDVMEDNAIPAKAVIVTPKQTPGTHPVQSELAVMGMIPDGDYRLISATVRCDAWTVSVEYDHPFPRTFLKARADYATEIIPVVLLSEPAVSDFWGNAESPNQQILPGLSILPIGFRFLWRGNRAVKPYMVGKLGAIVFTKKALSPAASYANFNVQAAFGLQMRLTERMDLRVEPFEFFHVSNGYLAASNPGMDELATRFGLAFHLRKKDRKR
jgi:hypothetical protein